MGAKIIDEFSDRDDLSASAKYYYRNRQVVNEARKLKRRNNPEQTRKKDKEYSLKRDKEKRRETCRAYKLRNPTRNLLHAAKKRAKDYNVPFSITIEDIIVPTHCPILGIELQFNTGTVKDNSPSVDRIKPELGYIKDNIRVISYKANRYKSNLSAEQLTRILAYIKGEI